MKRYWLLCFIFLIFNGNILAETYNAELPKDLDISTPYGTSAPSVIDNAIREPKRVYINEHNVTTITGSYTVFGTNTVIVGSSASGILLTFPAASSVATSTALKPYIVKNRGVGTMTLSILLDGVGSPTVTRNNARDIFTDGTYWYESTRVQTAGDADMLGGVAATGYARSGANADITSLNALTNPYMAQTNGTATGSQLTSVQISSGTATLSGIASPYVAQDGGTATLTSATIAGIAAPYIKQTGGTATGLQAAAIQISSGTSTLSSIASPYIAQTNGTATGATLNNTTISGTLSGVTHDLVTGTGTNSHAAIDTHLADTSDPHGTSLTQTNINVTTGTVSTLTGATGTFTGAVRASVFYGDGSTLSNIPTTALTEWRADGSTGTGSMRIAQGGGMVISAAYNNNGIGTITFATSGTASAGGWNDTGTTVVQETSTDIIRIDNASIIAGTGTLSNIASPYMAQTNGTASGSQLASVQISSGTSTLSSIASPYMAQTNGTATGSQLTNVQISSGTGTLSIGTITQARMVNATVTSTLSVATTTTTYAVNIGGTVTAKDVRAEFFTGDGSKLTGIASGVSQAQLDTMLALDSPSSNLYLINCDTLTGTHGAHAGTISSGRFYQITSLNSDTPSGTIPYIQIDDKPGYGLSGFNSGYTTGIEKIWIAGIGGGTVTFNIQNTGAAGTCSYSYIEYGTVSANGRNLTFNTASTIYGSHSTQIGTIASGHVWNITQTFKGGASGYSPSNGDAPICNIDNQIDFVPCKNTTYADNNIANVWISGLNGTRTIWMKTLGGAGTNAGLSYIDYLIQ